MAASQFLRSFVSAHECALMSNRIAATLGGLVGTHQGARVLGVATLRRFVGAHYRARAVSHMSLLHLHGRHFTTMERFLAKCPRTAAVPGLSRLPREPSRAARLPYLLEKSLFPASRNR